MFKERVWLCWLLLLALTITLSVNFTRIYFVALFVGLLFLFTRLNWKKVAIIFSRDISTIIRLFHRLTPYGQSWAKFRLGALGS